MLVTLLGGACSGTSSLTCALASDQGKPATFIATAEARDKGSAHRIERHRHERPEKRTTVKAPDKVFAARSEVGGEETAILACETLQIANLLEQGLRENEVVAVASALTRRTLTRPGLIVTASNEVGSGIIPEHALARHVHDVLGRVNAAVSLGADHAFLVAAGRALSLVHPTLNRKEAASW